MICKWTERSFDENEKACVRHESGCGKKTGRRKKDNNNTEGTGVRLRKRVSKFKSSNLNARLPKSAMSNSRFSVSKHVLRAGH